MIVAADDVASRTSWDCRRCGNPWPCASGKVEMLEQFRGHRVALLIYLASQMCDAIDDMSAARADRSSPDLYARFISWARAG